jgi:predicted enzyme related to lactoylglutathione lyase
MVIKIQSSFLPQTDPDASVAFYRDVLGVEVRLDVGYGGLRWITVGPPGQPDTNIVLAPPSAAPGITEDEKRMIGEMMAKGTCAILVLSMSDLDETLEKIQAAHAEVVQEPTDQPPTAFATPPSGIMLATSSGSTKGTEPWARDYDDSSSPLKSTLPASRIAARRAATTSGTSVLPLAQSSTSACTMVMNGEVDSSRYWSKPRARLRVESTARLSRSERPIISATASKSRNKRWRGDIRAAMRTFPPNTNAVQAIVTIPSTGAAMRPPSQPA